MDDNIFTRLQRSLDEEFCNCLEECIGFTIPKHSDNQVDILYDGRGLFSGSTFRYVRYPLTLQSISVESDPFSFTYEISCTVGAYMIDVFNDGKRMTLSASHCSPNWNKI